MIVVCVCAYIYVCVCVCPTLDKGFPPPLFLLYMSRGTELSDATLSNEARHQRGKHPLAMDVYLRSTFAQAVQSDRFDSWSFMIHPTNPPQPYSRLAAALNIRSSFRVPLQTKLNHTALRFFAFLPNVILALTENPSSKCVLLSRPTRVLSVIPFTGALFLHGKATTPTLHRSLEPHRKAPTPPQNQPTHRPPGQKTVLEESFRFRTYDLRFQHSVFFSCFPIMCVFPCSLCCCRDSFIDRTQG